MWKLIYSEEARTRLRAFLEAMPQLTDCVRAHLLELTEKPSRGQAAGFPYPPTGMVFHFDCFDGPDKHHFTIHYRYAQSEQGLCIFNIGHSHLV